MAGRLVDSLLAAVSPWRCVFCHGAAAGMDICPGCIDDLPWLGAVCRHCGLPLQPGEAACCAACGAADSRALLVDRCIPALRYEFPVDYLVTGTKYQQRLPLARVLGELLTIRLREEVGEPGFELPDVIVPVPLHPWRLLRRGFNQSAEIARWVSAGLGVPRAFGLVRRIRNTRSQAGLSRTARLQNMRHAFELTATVAGLRIAVLDDVITTAATVTELARLLRAGGAQEVQAWAVARTPD
jgi:ComF family protein